MKSQVIEGLWQEFYKMVGPANEADQQLLYGAFLSGMSSMLDLLVERDAITKSKLSLVVALINELNPETMD